MNKVECDTKQFYWNNIEYERRNFLLRKDNRTEEETKELVRLVEKVYNIYIDMGLIDTAAFLMAGVSPNLWPRSYIFGKSKNSG